jgi:hypothetical protein
MKIIRFSFTNEVAADAVTVTGSSQQSASFPAENLKTPQRPFLPWRTGATGAQSAVIDFGSAKTIDTLVLARTNFASANIQGNASNSWGSPSFDQAITIDQNPLTRRYQYGAVLIGFNYRYLRILIPSQTPVDGAAYYLLGGVWAGPQTLPPNSFLYQVEYETVEPLLDLQPEHKGWRQRLTLGEPLAKMTAKRMARTRFPTPFVNDHLRRWVMIDGQTREAGIFGFLCDNGDTSQSYVVSRITELRWNHNRQRVSESDIGLEEAIQ